MTSYRPTPKTSLTPPAWVRRKYYFALLTWLLIAAALVWASFGTDMSLQNLYRGLGRSVTFVFGSPDKPSWGFFPPDFTRWAIYLEQMLITVRMAVWGTALAFIAAIPLSFLAAANTSPHPVVYHVTRRLLDLMRGLNEFVLALIFVSAVGLGPFPGILALAIHTAGILAKLFAEGIEDVDKGQLEAIDATGARTMQRFSHAVWPQVLPHVTSMTLYRFESNVRAATVLGLVGAGGIGVYLTEAIRGFDFRAGCAIIIVILLAVFLIDFLGAKVREQLV